MTRRQFCWLASLACVAGCGEVDPLTREGLWRPTGANAANLRAMAAVPGDLAYGVAAQASDGQQAAKAMERLRAGKVYPLPDSNISKVGAGSVAATPNTGAGAPE